MKIFTLNCNVRELSLVEQLAELGDPALYHRVIERPDLVKLYHAHCSWSPNSDYSHVVLYYDAHSGPVQECIRVPKDIRTVKVIVPDNLAEDV